MLKKIALSPPLRLGAGILLLFGSVILALLLCEAYLGLTNYQRRTIVSGGPQPRDERLFLPDWQVGYRFQYNPPNFLPPDAQGRPIPLHFRTDSRLNRNLNDETFTVLMLGDSFTYGHMVAGRNSMPGQVETKLIRAGYNVNVLNAGVSGYGTDQMYVFGLRIVKKFKPDLVVVNVHVTDVYDNNDNCLFRKVGQQYWPVGAITHFEGLQLALVTYLPASISQSRLGNLALSHLNARINLACSIDKQSLSTEELDTLMLDKMVYLLTDLRQKLAKQDIKMMVTLGTFQAYFEPEAPEHLYHQMGLYQHLKETLEKHFEVVDVTKAIVETKHSLLLAQESLSSTASAYPATEAATVAEASSAGQVAGVQTISSSVFFNDAQSEPDSQLGHFHLNPYGNSIFADAVTNYILKTYSLPR
jgi:hypothetical protein